MKALRSFAAATGGLVLLAANASGQGTPARASPGSPATTSATDSWSITASTSAYFVPDSRDYLNPGFTADRGRLHLEGRYNYEALDTGSVWVGYNISVGHALVFEATPMLGAVFGDLGGIAPGCSLSLTYRRWALSSQDEYVFDSADASGSFFYVWSELSYAPLGWLRAGLVVQRTKAYKSDLDIQRGLLLDLSHGKVDFTAYLFNLGWERPTLVLAVAVTF
jgi:hypothetical protein